MNNIIKSSNGLDTSEELILQRCGSGIRLIKPKEPGKPQNDSQYSLAQVLKTRLNIYLMDGQSLLQKVNRPTAESCGYLSESGAVGRSVRDVSKSHTAARIIANDRLIMESNSLQVSHESFVRLDEQDVSAISIKFPWFNDNYEIIGIFGCSLMLDSHDYNVLAQSIYELMQTGLFSWSPTLVDSLLPGVRAGNIYFDRFEADILYHLVRGKSAKMIAKTLGLSYRTVEHRLEKIKIKAGCASKAELIEKFIYYFI